jgi:hypothetical protein
LSSTIIAPFTVRGVGGGDNKKEIFMKLFKRFRLDLFGEGGGASGATGGNAAAGSPSASATTTGVNSSAAENSDNLGVEGGKTDTPTKSLEERRKAYDAYIKGEGKEFYDKDTQEIVKKRVKDEKALKEQVGRLNPFIEALADKYGHDPSDLDGLMQKITNDRDFYAEAAAEAGMDSPETYRKFRESERKAKAFEAEQKRVADEAEAQKRQAFVDQQVQAWAKEAEVLKEKYPNLDLDKELDNKQFAGMLRAGVSFEAAYQAMHHAEIVANSVAAAKSETEKAVIDNLRAKGQRPDEAGASSTSAPLTGFDVRTLTRAQRAEFAKQAMQGKRIDFK